MTGDGDMDAGSAVESRDVDCSLHVGLDDSDRFYEERDLKRSTALASIQC